MTCEVTETLGCGAVAVGGGDVAQAIPFEIPSELAGRGAWQRHPQPAVAVETAEVTGVEPAVAPETGTVPSYAARVGLRPVVIRKSPFASAISWTSSAHSRRAST